MPDDWENAITSLLDRIPNFIRWALLLPVAVFADLASQTIGRIAIFAIAHSGGDWWARPYAEGLNWRVWGPMWFVLIGTLVAPESRRYVACVILVALKSLVAVYNAHFTVVYLLQGGRWNAVGDIGDIPAWWDMVSNAVSIAVLASLCFRFKRSKALNQKVLQL